jgi:hypothetical protein
VSLALFAITVCPTIPFGDGPELIAAADCLGVAHPPGYPLYTMLGWLVLHLPFGEPALRMNLMSALFGALTCAAVSWLVGRLQPSRVAAMAAGLGLAASSTFWSVATITEVYTLHLLLMTLLLCAAALIGAARSTAARDRALLGAAAVLGAGLAHHPTIVLALPAAAVLALSRRRSSERRRARTWICIGIATLLVIGIPLLLYLSLMYRARLGPPSNWGDPTTFDLLWAHVRAVGFEHQDLGWAGLAVGASWTRLAGLLVAEFNPLILPLAVIGLAGWPIAAAQVGWGGRAATGLLILPAVLFGLRYDAADVEVFYLPAFLGIAIAGGLGVAAFATHPRRSVRVAGWTVAALLVILTAFEHGSSRNLRGMTAAEDYARDLLDTLPPDGLLFIVSGDSFGLLYLTQVLGERPDVAIYDRSGSVFRDPLDDTSLEPVPGESHRALRLRAEKDLIALELTGAAPRPVMFLGWPSYAFPTAYRVEPVGLLHRVRHASEPSHDDSELWNGYRADGVLGQARRIDQVAALSAAAAYPVAQGERLLFLGEHDTGVATLTEAQAIAAPVAAIHSYIGTVYGRYGDFPRSIAAFKKAIEVSPTYFRAWNNLALVYELTGDRQAAREALRRSLEIAPAQVDAAQRLRRLEGA